MNGSQSGYVEYQRGLRQSDPLLSLLFVLVGDVLSLMFNHALNSGVLHRVSLSSLKKCATCNTLMIC